MKKIIILIIVLFTLTGCNTNYQSLNDMAIASTILLDKKDNTYIAYIEIYKEEKSDNNNKKQSYYINGKGNSIREAVYNATNMLSKTIYFVHINAVVLSKNIAEKNIKEIFNYLENKIQINTYFHILITEDIKKLINTKDEDNPILGEKIISSIKYTSNKGTMMQYDFLELLQIYMKKNQDIYLNIIDIKDNKTYINSAYYYSNNKLVGKLNEDELKLLNLFNKYTGILLNIDYNNNKYSLKTNTYSIKYKIENSINIKLNIKTKLEWASYNTTINSIKEINKLNKHSNNYVEKKLNTLLNKLQQDKSDLLGINDYIYKIYRNNKTNFFKDNISIKLNIEVSKKGLTLKTLGGTNE